MAETLFTDIINNLGKAKKEGKISGGYRYKDGKLNIGGGYYGDDSMFEIDVNKDGGNILFKKRFADGGSTNGSGDKAFSAKVKELMDDGYDFGEAVKEAMRQGYSEGGLSEEYYGKDQLDWIKNFKDQMTFEEYLRYKRSGSFASGGRVRMYAGGSLEPYLAEIKTKYLAGESYQQIFESNPTKYGGKATVAKAVIAMKNGTAPVKISAIELRNRIPESKTKLVNKIKTAYDTLKKTLKRNPTRGELISKANVVESTIRNNTPNLKFASLVQEGAKASTAMFKARKVNKPTRTKYNGVKGVKFKDTAQEAKYVKFLRKAATFPKGSPDNPYNHKWFAKTFKMPLTDVENVHKVVREKNKITYPKATDTSASRRSKQLTKTSFPALEQEYTNLKRDTKNIFNPDLAHRQSKTFNVTTSNLGLDNPVINRVIVKPNEKKISSEYQKRTKIYKKYAKKDGTFSKPSVEDSKKLRQINLKIRQLVSQTNSRLSGKISNPMDLNKPLKDFGIDFSKSIGGQLVRNVNLKEVRNLPIEKQNIIKENILKMKDLESKLTAQNIADEFPEMLKDKDVRIRLQNIINRKKQAKPILKMSQEILDLTKEIEVVKKHAASKGVSLNSFAGFVDFSQAGIELPPAVKQAASKILNVSGKVLRGAGKAAIVLDPMFAAYDFSTAIDKGVGGKEAGKYMVKKFSQDLLNLPNTLGGAVKFGSDFLKGKRGDDLEFETDTFYKDRTFATDSLNEVVKNTPRSTKVRNIANRNFDVGIGAGMRMVDDMEIPASAEEIEKARQIYLQNQMGPYYKYGIENLVEEEPEEKSLPNEGLLRILSNPTYKGVL